MSGVSVFPYLNFALRGRERKRERRSEKIERKGREKEIERGRERRDGKRDEREGGGLDFCVSIIEFCFTCIVVSGILFLHIATVVAINSSCHQTQ